MRASPALILYLMRREAFSATPYLDAAGVLTIGYGHVMRAHEKNTLVNITVAEAADLLDRDCDPIELYLDAIQVNFKTRLNQHQFDALVSFAFNVGLKAFENSTLLKYLRAGDHDNAAAEFDRWIYVTKTGKGGIKRKVRSRGLMNRRRMDRAIFERGVYAD